MGKGPSTGRGMLVPLIVACALFMENLDGTVIATALPQIADSLGTNPIRLSLALTAYLLALAAFIPVSGWFADRFGARVIFRGAIAVFTIGSILCGLSESLYQLAAARALQGIGGAMMVPVGRLVILRSVPKAQLLTAMSYLTVPAMLGPVLGPPVGGFVVTYWSWHWIFYLNVPIGLLGFVLVSLFIENHKEPDTPPLDVVGFILSTLALAGIVLGLEMAGRDASTLPYAILLLAGGLGAGLLYMRHAANHKFPLIDLLLFRFPTFSIAVLGGMLFRIGVGGLPFLLPLQLQLGFGMSAFSSGLLTFASAVGALAMKLTVRPILGRFGFRTVLVANALVSASFFFAYAAFQPGMSAFLILGLLLAGGFFRSLQFTSINTLAFAEVPQTRMSRATSISGTMQQLSGSIGVAFGGILLHTTLSWHGGATLGAGDFWPAFVVLGLVSAASCVPFARLSRDAGAEISGRTVATAATTGPAATK